MATKPFQFRYVNEIVGGFVLLVVALLVAAVFVAGRAQGWFEPVHRIHLDFPPQGTLDVQVGTPVQILGTTVGSVEVIDVDEDGFMTGVMTVKGDFFQFVRSDSQAVVKKKFGIAGDAFIEITKGTGEELPEGAGLVAIKDSDLNELLEQLLSQVRDATVPLLESVKKAADEYTMVAVDLRAPDGPLQRMLVNLESITKKIESGEGPAGRLIGDPEMAESIQNIIEQVNQAVAQLQAIMADVKGATVTLPVMAQTVNREVQDIPGTVAQTQQAIYEAERLIKGIQQNWLIRKHVPQEQPTALIPTFDIPRVSRSSGSAGDVPQEGAP
jgi:phospholipid/cholesterol/gamma-HCH transport system substrate-binding protein